MGKSTSKLMDTAAARRLAAKACFLALACLAFPAHYAAARDPLVQIDSIPLKSAEGRLDHLAMTPGHNACSLRPWKTTAWK